MQLMLRYEGLSRKARNQEAESATFFAAREFLAGGAARELSRVDRHRRHVEDK